MATSHKIALVDKGAPEMPAPLPASEAPKEEKPKAEEKYDEKN